MNLRKFYLIISIVLTIFLSTAGIVIISNLNATMAETVNTTGEYNDELVLDETTPSDDTEVIHPTTKPDFSDTEDVSIIKTNPINILIIGGDQSSQNTDTIFIMNYNPSTLELNLLSIPRDTRIVIDGLDRKMNFAYPTGGNGLIEEVIWDLLNIRIDRYMFLDISAFRDIIDVLGGIKYNVPVDMKYDDVAQGLHIDLKAGMQELDGAKAEQFVRFRKPNPDQELSEDYENYYNGSDILRINAQQDFIKEVIRQKATITNIPKVFSVLDIIFDRVTTDFTLNDIEGYLYNLDQIDIERVKLFTISGDDNIIDSIWFFEFNQKVDYRGAVYDADSVIKKYFKSNLD